MKVMSVTKFFGPSIAQKTIIIMFQNDALELKSYNNTCMTTVHSFE